MPIGSRVKFYRKRKSVVANSWQRYDYFLNSVNGNVLINRKEWRDGFGAVVSQDGTDIKVTGARVDDNGLTTITGSAESASYDVNEHNDLMHVVRSLEDQTHLSANTAVTDDAPSDPDWHEFGMDPVTFSDPGETNRDEVQLIGIDVDAGFSHAYITMRIRGDEQRASEAYVQYRRKGTTEWVRGPQLRGIHGVAADAQINLDRHISGPLLRLAPATRYEFQAVIEHPAALGSSTLFANPMTTATYEFKTRTQPYAPKDGSVLNFNSRGLLEAALNQTQTLPGGVINIEAGDYTWDGDTASATVWTINLSGTRERPLLIQGDGEVIIPRIIIEGSWVILHNIKVANHTAYEGDFSNSSNVTSTIRIANPDSEGIVLSKVDLHWHDDLPQTWEEGYRQNMNFDLKHTKIYGIPSEGGPGGPSPKWTVIENCDLTEGPKKDLEDIWNHQTRPVEWLGNEGFDIRHQSLVMRKNNVINNYDNSLTGTGNGNGLATYAYLSNNLFAFSHDDVIELEKGQGGNVLFDNIVAGAMAGNQPATGMATLPDTNTNRMDDRDITSATEVSPGTWEVEFTGSIPSNSSGALWQGGKCWTRQDLGQTSFPLVYTTDIGKANPGNDDIYASDADQIVVGPAVIQTTTRQPFNGSNTVSVQDSTTGTLPNWLVGWQHTGIHETGTPDSPWKWKQERAGNFVGCFQVTQRGCQHVFKPGDAGGYYFVNSTWMLAQASWDNYKTTSIEDMGSWYPTTTSNPFGLQDYNAFYNNNTSKFYWGNKTLGGMFSSYGIEEHSHDYYDKRNDDNVLDISYDNMWDEPARTNRDSNLRRPNWTYSTFPNSGGTMGEATLGTYLPLRAKATVDARNYGTGVPMSDPIAKVVGPSIDSGDDVSFLGAPNKTEDRTDVAPHQALMGSYVAGTVSVENFEQFSLPTGWTSEDPNDDALLASLGIVPTGGVQKLLLVNADQTVGLLVEKD